MTDPADNTGSTDSNDAVDVVVTGGTVRGSATDSGVVFRSIPYAAPPIGRRRFAAPQPVEPWTEVRDVRHARPIAPQLVSALDAVLSGGTAEQSEDCLTVSVTTPACDGGQRPVMVWIHGGAFTTGAGTIPWYRGGSFARDGVVVVSVNYRLGALGYLHLAELVGDEQFATAGNNGSLDQVAALRWVQENIAAFGGDPTNVTVFGESAGGCSVITLMAMPSARGLFQRAIAQSPSFRQLRDADRATECAERFIHHLGVDRAADVLSADVAEILRAQGSVAAELGADGFDVFSPTTGTVELPVDPRRAFVDGSAAAVPLVIGTNRDEMNLFTVVDSTFHELDRAGVVRRTHHVLGDADAAETMVASYERAYPAMTAPQLATRIATDHNFRVPAQRAAAAHSRFAPVFVYEFHWASPAFGGMLGSCHALEIPFVFDNLHMNGVEMFTGDGAERPALASRMHQAWVAFAVSGDPIGPEGGWPRHSEPTRTTVVFDSLDRIVDDPDRPLRLLWDELLP